MLGESEEVSSNNQNTGGAQNLGNLLETDLNVISIAGDLTGRTDLDFYKLNIDYADTELGPSIQAIGGVNEKIEGFDDACQAHGLTCSQGVMVPDANTRNLMLKSEVKARKF